MLPDENYLFDVTSRIRGGLDGFSAAGKLIFAGSSFQGQLMLLPKTLSEREESLGVDVNPYQYHLICQKI